MKILISGSTGFIGSALAPSLAAQGHNVKRLVRHTIVNPREEIHWEPAEGLIDENHLEDFDAVVHLAGENIAARRWSAAQKERIASSRVQGTRLLAGALAGVMQPPKVLVSASAIGYYGNRGDEVLTEEHEPGTGFLSDTSRAWEEATEAAERKGIRVVRMRFGVILSPSGGALGKMLLPFKLGLGGKIGSGRQYMSWIALDDVVGALQHAINNEDVMGPVNVVAPKAATNAEFTRALGRALSRPTIFPMPAFAARLAFGEMGDELLLGSTRVEPRKLLSTGYAFQYPELDGALRHLLGK